MDLQMLNSKSILCNGNNCDVILIVSLITIQITLLRIKVMFST
jgi:hypothetical protein